MNAGDKVGLLKNLCLAGTIEYDNIPAKTRYCAYLREDDRIYVKGGHRVLKREFLHVHSRLPKTVTANKEGNFQVGPANFVGKLTIEFDNHIGKTENKELSVTLKEATFTRS